MLADALAVSLPIKYNARGTYNHALTRTWGAPNEAKNTDTNAVVSFLENKAWPGELLRGHIEYDAGLAAFLQSKKIPQLLIIRKPLDVLLSLANWWERHNEIPVQPFLTYKQIESKEARLLFLLTGQHNGEQIWPNFIARCESYLPWLTNQNTLVVRYEHLRLQPEIEAQRIEAFLPMALNTERFIKKLSNRSNKTFTKPEEKVFVNLSNSIQEAYKDLGGEQLDEKVGYGV